MPADDKDTILILDSISETVGGPGRRPRQGRGLKDRLVISSERGVGDLKTSMKRFLEQVQAILAEGVDLGGDFRMDTVEVHAGITGEGRIGLAGVAMTAGGATGIKLVFTRRKEVDDG
jgi:hypothetical protein